MLQNLTIVIPVFVTVEKQLQPYTPRDNTPPDKKNVDLTVEHEGRACTCHDESKANIFALLSLPNFAVEQVPTGACEKKTEKEEHQDCPSSLSL